MCWKSGRCMLHSLKSPAFKGLEKELFHLRKLQMRADWVADEPVNYLERLFVRQGLQKCSAFQVSVFIRWNKALSVRNKLPVWQWCTRCPLIAFLGWLHPSCLTQSRWRCRLIFVTLLNKMVFTSCTTSASFTLGWVFIALTRTRNTPSLHVILDVAEVRWNDITTPGSQSGASGPAGLPPSRRDQSIQPTSLRVTTHERRRLMYTCHCMCP